MSAVTKAELEALVKRQQKSLDLAEAKNAKLQKSLARATTKNKLLSQSLKEALEQQTATAAVLKLISRMTFELQPVLDTLVRSAAELCEAQHALYYRIDPDGLRPEAWHNVRDEYIAFRKTHPIPVAPNFNMGRATLTRQPVHIYDLLAEPDYGNAQAVRLGEMRTVLGVPVLRQGDPIGVIGIFRQEVRPFTRKQIELVTTFADQAAIAIENVRLFKELQARNAEVIEALQQQTATAEILRVISTSPTDTQPVFDAIVASGLRFFPDGTVSLRLIRNDHFETAATTAPHGDFVVPLNDGRSASSRSVLRREPVQIPDFDTPPEWVGEALKEQAARFNWRALLGAPLLRENGAIGVIGVSRPKPGAFSDKEVALLQTFANQAVIAIENVRLFKELQARNAELTQSLERQTATSEVLKIISRSTFDLEPVLHALLDNAARLCRANRAVLFRQDGNVYPLAASYNATPELQHIFQANAIVPGRGTVSGRAMLERQAVHVADVLADPDYQWNEAARVGNYRTVLGVPLLREGIPIGVMGMTRDNVEPFTDQEIALVTTFADQAVIAIENVRLFKELQARNMELTESLEQQTATGKILRVISQSPTDVQPVFDTIAESAARLCECLNGVIFLRDGDRLVLAADCGPIPLGPIGEFALPLHRGNVPGRAIIDGQTVHVADLQSASGEFTEGSEVARRSGFRAALGVPLMRDGVAIGVLGARRAEAQLFSDRQVELLKTFADQAVIAIENVRLFNETKEALEQQTATAEILKVISSSPTDIQPVLDAVANAAARLCNSDDVYIRRIDAETTTIVAHVGNGSMTAEGIVRPLRLNTFVGAIARERRTIHIPDITEAHVREKYSDSLAPGGLEMRTRLYVPLLREGAAIGVIVLRRNEVRPFTDKQIQLLETFAAQAVIAIENVRLFRELEARNGALSESLARQTATADILRIISTNLTDVQPVLDAVAESAARLCGADDVVIRLVEGEMHRPVAHYGTLGVRVESRPLRSSPGTGRALLERRTIHVEDAALHDEYDGYGIRSLGVRTFLVVPLLREDKAIGAIVLRRLEVNPFSVTQIELLETFAAQAVIAIENVRLFNELQARNAEMTETLEQQTVTSEILRIISSSPTDSQPVFDAIVKSGVHLFAGMNMTLRLVRGDHTEPVASTRPMSNEDRVAVPLSDDRSLGSRAMRSGEVMQIPDMAANDWAAESSKERAVRRGWRAVLSAPMMKEGVAIGVINVTRAAPGLFTDREIALLRTFADQAVIAIENARLFKELQARNAELTEALDQQTATAEILRVISSSPTDIQPVLDAVAESAARLCDATDVLIRQVSANRTRVVAHVGPMPIYPGTLSSDVTSETPGGRAILERRTIHIADVMDPQICEQYPKGPWMRYPEGTRTALFVPMLLEDVAIGNIIIRRPDVRPFSDKQIRLLETFAAQAVIAIENVRLFKELQAQTEALSRSVNQLTALGEVGQAISSSLDLETVLRTIVSRALQLTGLDSGTIYEYDPQAQVFRLQAAENMPEEIIEPVRDTPVRMGDGLIGRIGVTRELTQIPDILDESYQSTRRAELVRAGYRALLAVPLLRDERLLGVLLVHRKSPGEFAPDVVDLLKTFATQSALAIHNARLFREIAEKSRQLEVASQHKSQFLASMSHELRTPLNAILGFNEMMLDGLYGELPEDLKDPLQETQTSGRHLLRLINNVLDLAKIEAGRMELALADYSVEDLVESVRSTLRPLAEAKGLEFNIVVPSDIPLAYGDAGRLTQSLMNLAGNSLKFTRAGQVAISVAATGDILAFRVVDTGIGIAPEKIDSLFTEFKQTDATIASEYGGTGLGLAITRQFIEMHGGRIWVESELGKGSTFIFEIPLRAQAI